MEYLIFSVIVVILFVLIVLTVIVINKEPVKLEIPKTTYVPAISTFDKDKEVTTVVPVPMGAHTCIHDWDILTKETLEVNHQQKLVIILQCPKCGLLDKTIQITDKPPPNPSPPRSECFHRWEKEKVVILESPWEQMAKVKGNNGQWKKDVKVPEMDMKKLEPWFFKKRYVSVRTCRNCGEIDRIVTSNYGDEDENADDEN